MAFIQACVLEVTCHIADIEVIFMKGYKFSKQLKILSSCSECQFSCTIFWFNWPYVPSKKRILCVPYLSYLLRSDSVSVSLSNNTYHSWIAYFLSFLLECLQCWNSSSFCSYIFSLIKWISYHKLSNSIFHFFSSKLNLCIEIENRGRKKKANNCRYIYL